MELSLPLNADLFIFIQHYGFPHGESDTRFGHSTLIRHPAIHVENKVITPFRDLIDIQCEYRAIDPLAQPKEAAVERGIEKNSERTVLHRPGEAERCRSQRLRGLSPVRSSRQLLQGRITARNNAYVSCQCVNLSRMSCSDPRILTSSPQVHFNRRLVRLRFCMLVPAPQSPQHEKARCKHGQGEG